MKKSADGVEPEQNSQRLYRLSFNLYVQYGREDEMPEALAKYVQERKGELPAYIPLPKGPVTFRLGEGSASSWSVQWDGEEPLPEAVLQYVLENRSLPGHGCFDVKMAYPVSDGQ